MWRAAARLPRSANARAVGRQCHPPPLHVHRLARSARVVTAVRSTVPRLSGERRWLSALSGGGNGDGDDDDPKKKKKKKEDSDGESSSSEDDATDDSEDEGEEEGGDGEDAAAKQVHVRSVDMTLPRALNQKLDALQYNRNRPAPKSVLAVPLWKRPFFPGMWSPTFFQDVEFTSLLEQRKAKNEGFGLFLAKDQNQTRIRDVKDLHPMGVLAQAVAIEPTPTEGTSALFWGFYRIRLVGPATSDSGGGLVVDIERVQDEPYDPKDPEIRAYQGSIVAQIRQILKLPHHSPMWSQHLQMFMQEAADPKDAGELADLAACLTSGSADELQPVINATDVKERMRLVLQLLRAEYERGSMQAKIQKEVEQNMGKTQRNYLLSEQLKYIKRELGMEKDEKVDVIAKFQKRLEDKVLTEEVQRVIDEELNKLRTLDPSASEYNVTRNYLDWLTLLPWGQMKPENIDVIHASKVLEEDHYGLEDVKERILEFVAVGQLRKSITGKILCFVGPPGVGKTSIGKSIARSVNRDFYRFSVGGLGDIAEIKGHRRTYVGAMPGKMIQALKSVKSANPVIMIDEIDKMGRGNHGDPASALLEVLDPEQNSAFADHYLDVPFDLSKVLFVCTANSKETIPAPLLDRMEVINLSGYVMEEKLAIATKYLIPTARSEAGLRANQVKITKDALIVLIRDYCREAGVRNMQKQIEKTMRKAAYRVVVDAAKRKKEAEKAARKRRREQGAIDASAEKSAGDTEKVAVDETPVLPEVVAKVESSPPIEVTVDNLKDFVGQPKFNSDRYYEKPGPGVVMGLAWTSMGGATLYVETVSEKSEKEESVPTLKITGQLGDVMKESTDIAFTYGKLFLEELGEDLGAFAGRRMHMHIPEGATPKDGPSAGVTMVTSLLSLITNRSVKDNVAMTGELTLTGKILPVGGIREKLIAAKRSGVTTVLLPKENRKDVVDLPSYIVKGLKIRYADYYSDVYKIVFEDSKDKPEARKTRSRKKAKKVTKKGITAASEGTNKAFD